MLQRNLRLQIDRIIRCRNGLWSLLIWDSSEAYKILGKPKPGSERKRSGVCPILSLSLLGLPRKFNFMLLFFVSSLSLIVISTFASKI